MVRIAISLYHHRSRRCVTPLLRRLSLPNAHRYLSSASSSSKGDPHAAFREQLKELQEERELLFGFTEEETSAWQNSSGGTSASSQLEAIHEARIAQQYDINTTPGGSDAPHSAVEMEEVEEEGQQPSLFTHISQDDGGATMVDVSYKQVTRRVARAQTQVIFPPEVMSAFQHLRNSTTRNDPDELVGPKGPIFATAKLAGIMAAKKTSDLIPLCHPLSLDRVTVDVTLSQNIATIECECTVTHKTGVEMEALTGATVTALTIYDMVKAVSHRVEISNTKLISKSGGKRDITPT